MQSARPPLLTVFYDGKRPVCTREVGFYRRRRGAESIRRVNLAQCEDSEPGADLSRDAAYARLRAFAALWQALPAFRLAGRTPPCLASCRCWIGVIGDF